MNYMRNYIIGKISSLLWSLTNDLRIIQINTKAVNCPFKLGVKIFFFPRKPPMYVLFILVFFSCSNYCFKKLWTSPSDSTTSTKSTSPLLQQRQNCIDNHINQCTALMHSVSMIISVLWISRGLRTKNKIKIVCSNTIEDCNIVKSQKMTL